MKISEILDNKMPSFTEWFDEFDYKDKEKFREEDNTKRDRLEILFQEIGLPYDRPERMLTTDIVNQTPLFKKIMAEKAKLPCALRLVPFSPELPKLRQRGKTLEEYITNWFPTLTIDPNKYKVEVVPHSDETEFSITAIINDRGIFGEITPGGHWQLTQGFFEDRPTTFYFDFQTLKLSKENPEVEKIIQEMFKKLIIPENKREILQEKIQAEFTPTGYLKGYFEYALWPNNFGHFVDYNRLLPKMLMDLPIPNFNIKNNNELSGVCASPGEVTGTIKIILNPIEETIQFENNDILVCLMTTIDYVPLMKKASAIITEQGNILSHAAIVCREMKKPCLVGVKNALNKLKNNEKIEVNATHGIIKKLA